MLIEDNLFLVVFLLMILFLLLYIKSKKEIVKLKINIEELLFQKQSQSSKYGKISEQFMPFLEVYPYNPSGFRFIGTPIDGIQFDEDRVIFLEFKTNSSRLSLSQQRIKELIKNKQVEWEEYCLK